MKNTSMVLGGIAMSAQNRLTLTTRGTAIDLGSIMCNPTSGASGGSKKGQIWLNFKNEFI
jgi:hypothetical protein